MLVPSMNFQEIRKEISKDYPLVFRKASFIGRKLYRLLSPKKDQTVCRTFDYTSYNKNNWLYRVFFKNKKEYYQLMVYHYNNKGLCVYQMYPENDYLLHYTSHFFSRYNERCALNLVKPTDIVKAFINDNCEYLIYKRKVLRAGIRKFFCLTSRGIILGTENEKEKIYHFNTFIPYSALYKRQIRIVKEIYHYAQQNLQEAIKQHVPPEYWERAA